MRPVPDPKSRFPCQDQPVFGALQRTTFPHSTTLGPCTPQAMRQTDSQTNQQTDTQTAANLEPKLHTQTHPKLCLPRVRLLETSEFVHCFALQGPPLQMVLRDLSWCN